MSFSYVALNLLRGVHIIKRTLVTWLISSCHVTNERVFNLQGVSVSFVGAVR